METKLPKDVEAIFIELHTLIGESLIDEKIENRKPFEKAQNKIFDLIKKYDVKLK